MKEPKKKGKFENLQPMKFLRTFNRMVDEDSKHLPKASEKQLKMFQLSKFPLPHFYEAMEGIFETGTKKHEVRASEQPKKDDVEEENFIRKNREFMSKHLLKLIRENKQHQKDLQQERNLRQRLNQSNKSVPALRVKSQVKMKKLKSMVSSINKKCLNRKNNAESPLLRKLQRAAQLESPEDQAQYTYMQKLHQERMDSFKKPKQQKIKLRSKEQVMSYLATRKEGLPLGHTEPADKVQGPQYDPISAEDRKKKYVKDLIRLSQQQNEYQRTYSAQVEEDISNFSRTIDMSIQRVKSYRVG